MSVFACTNTDAGVLGRLIRVNFFTLREETNLTFKQLIINAMMPTWWILLIYYAGNEGLFCNYFERLTCFAKTPLPVFFRDLNQEIILFQESQDPKVNPDYNLTDVRLIQDHHDFSSNMPHKTPSTLRNLWLTPNAFWVNQRFLSYLYIDHLYRNRYWHYLRKNP